MAILRLLAWRSILAGLTLLLVSLIVFLMLEVLPGYVATRILGRDATPETLAVLRLGKGGDVRLRAREASLRANLTVVGWIR